jgi:superfamily II DNA helicase RecQ
MSQRSRRVTVNLDAKGLKELSDDDLKALLRGADDLIAHGGRTLLMRILRGSANKDVLERGLDQSPVYGYFRDLSDDDTLARIDWAILNGYLRIEYSHRLPLLVYTQKGWEIERETYANELLESVEATLRDGPPYQMAHLKDRDRGMILLLLDKIAATGDRKFIPTLKAWKKLDFKKVQHRIGQIIRRLEASADQ